MPLKLVVLGPVVPERCLSMPTSRCKDCLAGAPVPRDCHTAVENHAELVARSENLGGFHYRRSVAAGPQQLLHALETE